MPDKPIELETIYKKVPLSTLINKYIKELDVEAFRTQHYINIKEEVLIEIQTRKKEVT
jgi:hypothetical protein